MIPGTPLTRLGAGGFSTVETTTFDQDPAAVEAANAALVRLRPALADAADPALAARGTGIAQVVAHYDPDPAVVGGTLLYVLLGSGAASESRASAVASPEELAFARALARLGQFDVSAQWQPAPGPASAAAVGTDLPAALGGAQAEGLRKMLLAVIDDPRLVLARVAEHLWALRGAKSLDETARRKLALQAREVYGPLANRLGLAHLKWELEDHAFRVLEPAEYRRIAGALNERRAARERYIAELRELLTAELAKAGVVGEVQGRPKHIYSIWRKMTRKHLAFEQVFDVRAVRILVGTVAECYAALGVVHGLYQYVPGEFDDYVATPKPNGYRSIHTAVIGPQGKPVEVQIRTREMHDRAELGVAAHWRYKEGGKRDVGFERKLERLRELLAPGTGGGAAPEGLIDRLGASLFADHVYVVSPKGDVVELPAGSTPLDFAYHVHTSLGHRCRGAKVDGRMVALDYRLKNGEAVEIIAAKEPQPSRDWLVESRGFLASKSARAKVRAFFRREDEDDHRQAGLAILERELDRLGAGPGGRTVLPLPDLLAELKYDHADELYVALGAGDLTPTQLANAVQRRLKAAEPAAAASSVTTIGTTAAVAKEAAGISVMGIEDLMSSYAQCCRPVPPEPVAGYVTVGRGVTIHRIDCANLKRLRAKQPDRVVEVGWGADADRLYGVEVTVQAYDRRGLLRDITGAFADAKLSIDRMSTVTHHAENVADMTLAVRVHDVPELEAVLARVRALPGILVARRK